MDDVYAQMAAKIIQQQESIIGPLAVEQAKQVPEIQIDDVQHTVTILGDGSTVIDKLVEQYKKLFGQISVEVCKEAAAKVKTPLLPDQLPRSLQ